MSIALRPTPTPRPIGGVFEAAGIAVQWTTPATAQTGQVAGITHDSRAVRPGDMYVAISGYVTHGAKFAHSAVEAGAVCVVTDSAGAALCESVGVPVAIVDDPRAVMGLLADVIYGRPSSVIPVVGITGTNGKTTTSYLLAGVLREAGHRVGVIGTTGITVGEASIPSARTTPESSDLHALIAVMVERGATAVVMEVSSHALTLHRVSGMRFAVVGFTNLSMDHLDFHHTMDDYFAAKSSLFDPHYASRGVVCIDGPWGQALASNTTISIDTVSVGSLADWSVTSSEPTGSQQALKISSPFGDIHASIALPGIFNAANAVLALALAASIGVDVTLAARGLEHIQVPGRLEIVESAGRSVGIVDYAHTPDAVERVLVAARDVTTGRLVTVMGCGGDRDREKRPVMGEVAGRLSDVVIVTDDNPRSEDPALIRAAIIAGIADRSNVIEIADRRRAIREAVSLTTAGDAVVVLGKGHEQGQYVGDVVIPFDDRDELRRAYVEVPA